jgi:hypothetical protein
MSLRERTRPGLGIVEPCLPSPAKAPPSALETVGRYLSYFAGSFGIRICSPQTKSIFNRLTDPSFASQHHVD